MDRDSLSHLTLFAAVAHDGGFRSAARRLEMAPSSLSHAVGMMETRLGVRLFNRTTRSLALTEAGQRLLARLDPALGEIEAAVRDACEADAMPAGRIRINAPRFAAAQLLAPHLGDFAESHPAINLDVAIEDRFVDIVAEGFDAGLRLGENLQPDMIATRIGGPQRLAIVAAPAYLERHGRPETLEALAQHRCLQRRFTGGNLYAWEVVRDGQEITLSDMAGSLTANDDFLIYQAAVAGAGIAFIYEWRAAEDIAAGRLIELFPDNCPPFSGFFIYHSSRRHMRPALRAFIDFFVAANRGSR
ncbi:DNA-binding transcriptional LysR family regulator [Sphingomonas sp. UYAg733]